MLRGIDPEADADVNTASTSRAAVAAGVDWQAL